MNQLYVLGKKKWHDTLCGSRISIMQILTDLAHQSNIIYIPYLAKVLVVKL